MGRKTDPVIAARIYRYLNNAASILNIGAGTGSYELSGKPLIALEPSEAMIKQRPAGAYPVKHASAESLPFNTGAFTHAMTVLSMHHWEDREAAFNEIKRVITKRFVAVTWNPQSDRYWLTQDYFPEIHDIDHTIFPTLNELETAFPGIRFYSLPIPSNCIDGFMAAYWSRPYAYLDPQVRQSMSTFSKIQNVDAGIQKLQHELDSGIWHSKYGALLRKDDLDVGYTVAVWDVE